MKAVLAKKKSFQKVTFTLIFMRSMYGFYVYHLWMAKTSSLTCAGIFQFYLLGMKLFNFVWFDNRVMYWNSQLLDKNLIESI